MSIWRFCLGLWGLFLGVMVQAQPLSPAQEAERLRAAGFPVIDVDGQLDEAARQQLLLELEWLQICCEFDLVIVLQEESLTGSARADLRQLQQQLLRTDLWTDQTALLLIQSSPPLAEVARAATLQANTSALSPEALAELGRQAGTPALSPRLMQMLRAVSQGAALPSQPSRTPLLTQAQLEAAWHLGVLLIALVLSSMALLILRRLPPVLAKGPALAQALPRGFGRVFAKAQLDVEPLPSTLLISVSGRRRHLGLCLALATLLGLGFWAGQEVLGLALFERLGFDALQQLWLFRALVTLAAASVLFLILSLSPLGAWMTPPGWRRSLLARRLRQIAGDFRGPILVWRRVAGRLELWQDARQGPLPKTFTAAFERLVQDATHGHAGQGLSQFQKHAERYLSAR